MCYVFHVGFLHGLELVGLVKWCGIDLCMMDEMFNTHMLAYIIKLLNTHCHFKPVTSESLVMLDWLIKDGCIC